MQDLNATIFFKAKFHIYATSGENDDLLWKLILDIRSWITKKLNRPGCHPVIESSLHKWTFFKKGGKFYDLEPLNRVYAESVFHQARTNHLKFPGRAKLWKSQRLKVVMRLVNGLLKLVIRPTQTLLRKYHML